PSSTITSTLVLDGEQYRVYDILCNSWGPDHENKHPYFFMTGSAGTGKSFMIRHVVNMLETKKIKYLLMSSTGVSAQSIGGRTIHSALRIRQFDGHYQMLLLDDETSRMELLEIKAIVLDKVSIVADKLFMFTSNMFGSLHKNHKAFGGIP